MLEAEPEVTTPRRHLSFAFVTLVSLSCWIGFQFLSFEVYRASEGSYSWGTLGPVRPDLSLWRVLLFLIADPIRLFATWVFVSSTLVLAGRRRIFALPVLIALGTQALNTAYYYFQWRPNYLRETPQLALLEVFTPIVLGVFALAPAVALARTTESQARRRRPEWGGWLYLGGLFLVAGCAMAFLRPLVAGFGYIGDPVWSFLYPVPFLIFGAGIGKRRPWWPGALAMPAAIYLIEEVASLALRVPPEGRPEYNWLSELLRGPVALDWMFTFLLMLAVPYAAAIWEPLDRYFRGWKYRCAPGEEVVLRERWQGGIWAARPAVVVEDKRSEKRFFVPTGVKWWYPADDDGDEMRLPLEDWRLEEGEMNTRNILSFAWPHRPYSVFIAWDPDWNFTGYYINLQTPLERTEFGFDYTDHVLDIEMSPDKSSWTWKDEEELAQMVEEGLFTQEQADDFRAWGETAVEQIRFETPFDEDWSEWRPGPEWPLPELDPDWDELD